MEKKIVVQRIVNRSESSLDVAVKYYHILSILNNIPLTDTEIKLLAFMSLNGSISSGGAKEAFGQLTGSPKASIGNIVWRLKKRGILVRHGRKIFINPTLLLDFNNILVLQITLRHGQ